MQTLEAYKVFNPDWTCRGYDFKTNNGSAIGSKHETKTANLCNSGFHACVNVADCFNYYYFNPENKVAKVILSGDIKGVGEEKSCATCIEIVSELTWFEMLTLANTGQGNSGLKNSGNRNSGYRNSGDLNSGDRNSGDRNSGYRNSGDRNSGDRNSGDRNSGNRNSGNRNSGYLNSGNRNSGYRNSGDLNSGDLNSGDLNSGDLNSGNRNSGYRNSGDLNSGYRNSGVFCNKKREDKAFFFNKESYITWEEWENSMAYDYLSNLEVTTWVPENIMSEQEKNDHPEYKTTEGYLKAVDYKEAWGNLWNNLSNEAKKCVLALPNFDNTIFEDITGIKL